MLHYSSHTTISLQKVTVCLFLLSSYDRRTIITAGSDFTPPDSLDVLFTEEGSQCFNVTILDDECVEDDESFEVSLTTSDDDVDIHTSLAFIVIIDTDGKILTFKYLAIIYLQMQLHSLVWGRKLRMWWRVLSQSCYVLSLWMAAFNDQSGSPTQPLMAQLKVCLLLESSKILGIHTQL